MIVRYAANLSVPLQLSITIPNIYSTGYRSWPIQANPVKPFWINWTKLHRFSATRR